MRRRAGVLGLLLGLAGCAGPAAPGDGVCRLAEVATLRLLPGRGVIVDGAIGRRPARLMLDTGAAGSYAAPWTVGALGVGRARGTRRVLGIGGVLDAEQGTARIELGGDEVVRTVGLIPLPADGAGRPVAALLGTDVLARYDMEVSFPDRHVRLWLTEGCTGAYAPWSGPYEALTLERGAGGALFVPVSVDGRTVKALLDTGADRSVLTTRAARRLGVTEAALLADPVSRGLGADGNPLQGRVHRFGSVGVGGDVFDGQRVVVSDAAIPGAEMLLGLDWMLGRRVWISWSAGRMFVQEAAVAPPPPPSAPDALPGALPGAPPGGVPAGRGGAMVRP